MTLRHFRIFWVVCQTGSITKAAEELNMTQPAVSLAIRELEEYYRTKLFERMNRRIYLTESGRQLQQYADSVLSQVEESVQTIRDPDNSAECRIGANVTISEVFLDTALQAIEADNPRIRLQVLIGDTREIAQKLAANEIDFAAVDAPAQMENTIRQKIADGTMAAVASPRLSLPGRLSLARLAQQRLLLREKGSASRNEIEAVFHQHGITLTPAVESVSTLSLIRLAESGFGVTILPQQLAAEPIRRHQLQELTVSDASFDRSYHLVYHKGKYLTETMRRAMHQFTAAVAAAQEQDFAKK